MEKNRCCECRNGEHENYDNDIFLVTVRDPDSKRIVLRGYLCGEHRGARLDDGYEVLDNHSGVK